MVVVAVAVIIMTAVITAVAMVIFIMEAVMAVITASTEEGIPIWGEVAAVANGFPIRGSIPIM